MQTLLAELLQMLGGLLQLLRPLLASLLQRPAVFFNPLQQVIQTQGQHPQVGDGHSSSLWRCGGTTRQGCTGGLLPESHQENRELQDSTSAHDEEWTGGPGSSVFTGFTGVQCKSRAMLVPQEVNPRWSSESPGGLLWRRSGVRCRM